VKGIPVFLCAVLPLEAVAPPLEASCDSSLLSLVFSFQELPRAKGDLDRCGDGLRLPEAEEGPAAAREGEDVRLGDFLRGDVLPEEGVLEFAAARTSGERLVGDILIAFDILTALRNWVRDDSDSKKPILISSSLVSFSFLARSSRWLWGRLFQWL